MISASRFFKHLDSVSAFRNLVLLLFCWTVQIHCQLNENYCPVTWPGSLQSYWHRIMFWVLRLEAFDQVLFSQETLRPSTLTVYFQINRIIVFLLLQSSQRCLNIHPQTVDCKRKPSCSGHSWGLHDYQCFLWLPTRVKFVEEGCHGCTETASAETQIVYKMAISVHCLTTTAIRF